MNDKDCNKPEREATVPILLTAGEVAYELRKSVRWVWSARSAGLLPRAVSVGGSRRWLAADLLLWARSGCPNEEEFSKLKNMERKNNANE